MLNVSGLWAEYQGKPALQDVSLQIASGQLVVVLGPSGCGKTTLLNLIAGFMTPSAGVITLDNIPVSGPSAERGVVFQNEGLLPWRDVVSNVEFGLQLAGMSKEQRRVTALKM
ncbi:taurine ABC transporter ATP-binding subunit, partial [Yersinia pestis]